MFKTLNKQLKALGLTQSRPKPSQQSPQLVRPQGVSAPSSLMSRRAVPSVISADMNILGNIISDGVMDIDGRIEGNVRCGSVTIRSKGIVKGDVVAESVSVYGEVTGLIKAKHVHLYPTARVEGIIMHESLSIQDGAFVDGKFKRTDKVFMEEEYEFDGVDSFDTLENLRLISDNG